jgi:hypothetical protein
MLREIQMNIERAENMELVERGAEYLRQAWAAETIGAQALAKFDAIGEALIEAGHDIVDVTRLAYERAAETYTPPHTTT